MIPREVGQTADIGNTVAPVTPISGTPATPDTPTTRSITTFNPFATAAQNIVTQKKSLTALALATEGVRIAPWTPSAGQQQHVVQTQEQISDVPAPHPVPVKMINPWEGAAGILLNLDFARGLPGLIAASEIANPFISKYQKQRDVGTLYESYRFGAEEYLPYKKDPSRMFYSPLAVSLYTLPIGYGAGAGLGALQAVSPTAAKIAGDVLFGYAFEETVRGGYDAFKSGDFFNYAGQTALQFGLGGAFFKKGFSSVGGRVEEFLYARKTFKPGSPEAVRLQAGLKVSRLVGDVSPAKIEPVDFSDIQRFTPEHVAAVEDYLGSHPNATIGGSEAAYTQVLNAREPRDLDLFIQSRFNNEGNITEAKEFFDTLTKSPEGQHVVDIHGREMYYPGKQLQFGFRSKTQLQIGDYDVMRAGEQLFRKAIGGTTLETQYRWFKDIPDFITTAESQIMSAKTGFFTRGKGLRAEVALDIFKSTLTGTEYMPLSPELAGVSEFMVFPDETYAGYSKQPMERFYIKGYQSSKSLPSPFTFTPGGSSSSPAPTISDRGYTPIAKGGYPGYATPRNTSPYVSIPRKTTGLPYLPSSKPYKPISPILPYHNPKSMPGLPPSMKPAVYKPQKGYPQYTPFQQSRRLPFIDVGGKGKEHHEKALVDWERYFRTRRFKIGSIENALGFSSSKKGRRRHGGFAL